MRRNSPCPALDYVLCTSMPLHTHRLTDQPRRMLSFERTHQKQGPACTQFWVPETVYQRQQRCTTSACSHHGGFPCLETHDTRSTHTASGDTDCCMQGVWPGGHATTNRDHATLQTDEYGCPEKKMLLQEMMPHAPHTLRQLAAQSAGGRQALPAQPAMLSGRKSYMLHDKEGLGQPHAGSAEERDLHSNTPRCLDNNASACLAHPVGVGKERCSHTYIHTCAHVRVLAQQQKRLMPTYTATLPGYCNCCKRKASLCSLPSVLHCTRQEWDQRGT